MRTDRGIDGQPDRTKLIIGLQNFAKAPKSEKKAFFRQWTVICVQNK
jgi:hypothetical protein